MMEASVLVILRTEGHLLRVFLKSDHTSSDEFIASMVGMWVADQVDGCEMLFTSFDWVGFLSVIGVGLPPP